MALIETRITSSGIQTYDKVAVAIENLKTYEAIANDKYDADGKNGYYVCISGGKDSSVIQELCIMAGVNCQFYHNHTGLDHPETVYFIRREKARLEAMGYEFNICYPQKRIFQLVKEKKMLPTRLIRYCCSELKEGGGKDRFIVTGVRRFESVNRRGAALAETRGATKKTRIIIQNDNTEERRSVEQCTILGTIALNVIVEWSDEDVWEFIKTYNVPYNPLYDMGYKRVGCVGCPMSTKKREELDNNPKFKAMWLRMCRWLYENYSFKRFESPEDMYDWWTKKNKNSQDELADQMKLMEDDDG